MKKSFVPPALACPPSQWMQDFIPLSPSMKRQRNLYGLVFST
jgi:hypothetical protein